MKNKSSIRIIRLFLIAISFANYLVAQNPSLEVFEEWTAPGGYLTFHQKNRTITDASGNVYVAGTTRNVFGNYDMLTAKYASDGSLLWQQVYAGAGGGDDGATDVITDLLGNVYITGSYYKNSTDSNNAITIKYNSSGVQQWMQEYNGTGSRNDAMVRLELDGADLYAVGSAYSGTSDQYDFLVIKYHVLGVQYWASVWDNAGLLDGAVRVRVKNAKVTVAGGSQINATQYKYAVANFSVLNGTFLNAHTSGGNQPISFDNVTDLLIDNNGDVFITGGVQNSGVGYDIRTIKLDQLNLSIQWSATYNGSSNLDDVGNAIVADANGDIYITGYETVTGQGKNYVTIKYASSNGAVQWTTIYNDSDNGDDAAAAIGVQGAGRVYVTGAAFNGSTLDYYTIAYDASNGNLIWQIGYNGLANMDDRAADLSVLGNGELIVTGTAFENPIKAKYVTVKYVEKNTTMHKDTISFPSSSYAFIENRGQLIGNDASAHPEVKYYAFENHPRLYFTDTSVIYALSKADTSIANNDSLFRVDMKFVNGNADQKIRSLKQRDDYCNFFYDHAERSRVQNYDELISFNVWNNVDIVYGSNTAGFKYYFICKPTGGSGSAYQIDLQYEGADSVKIDGSGQLVIYTAFGNIVQRKAHVWQIDASGNFSALAWQPSYTMLGPDEVGFSSFGSYNSAFPLVIAVDWGNGPYPMMSVDNLLYSGWYGVGEGEIYRDIKVGHDGRVHTCGQTSSTAFPATAGVVQSSFGFGSRDAIVVQYDPNGSRNWATYYGGLGWDIAHGIDLDDTGAIYFAGETTTSPVSSAIHPFYKLWGSFGYVDSTLNTVSTTNKDGFIVRLSPDGEERQWATYLGGNGNDLAYAIAVSETTGEIWVGGSGDTTGFPLLPSIYWNSTYGGGMIWRFNLIGQRIYSCFIGPTSNSAAIHALVVDSLGDAVAAGTTGSGFPVTSGCAQFTYGGGLRDGFVVKFDGVDEDVIKWATYHGGEDVDAVMGIDVSPYGSATKYFASGYTYSDSLPFTVAGGGAYIDSTLNGTEDAFIAEFDTAGTRFWATYYGGSSDEESYDCTTDNYGNTYLVTWTLSTNVTTTCPNGSTYCNTSNSGSGEGVLVMFSEGSRALNWSTYFGGSAGESPYAVDCEDTSLYMVGDVVSASNVGYPFRFGYVVAGMGTPYHTNDNPGTFNKAFLAQFALVPIVTGLTENVQEPLNELLVYPNPAADNITIIGNVNAKDNLTIEIVDILGQVVYTENLKPAYSVNKSVDVSNLANGMYVIRIVSDETVYTNKVLIQH